MGDSVNLDHYGVAADHYWSRQRGIADLVWAERHRQLKRWGLQERDSGTSAADWLSVCNFIRHETDRKTDEGTVTWVDILHEEILEVFSEEDPEKLKIELIQVMAVAASWYQDLVRRPVRAT